ncbi:NACHT domain-containing protein [Dactylosporangium sp. NPDC049140]|uniref:NACHT domain-containing protein n=1 Tax=Dactylosporangium sp. NPDC049140 TaxID=3155647 RepID=UPI003407A76D
MIETWADLAASLARLKDNSGYSYAEIARLSGRVISKSTAANLAKGLTRPVRATLVGYLIGTKVPPEEHAPYLEALGRLKAPPVPPPGPEPSPAAMLGPYLEYLRQRWMYLDLSILSDVAASADQRGTRRTMAHQFVEPHLGPLSSPQDPIPASAAFASSPTFAVVGEPGTGKSTLLQHMAWATAEACAAGDRLRVPFLIQVGDLVGWNWAEDRDTFPFGYIMQEASATGVPVAADELQELLNTGACLFLFDGIDEAGPSTAAMLLKRIRGLVSVINARHPGNQVVVSTRPTYLDLLADLFDIYWLDGFSWREVEQFARRWEQLAPGAPTRRRTLLGSVSDPRIRRLMTRPLYLTIVALLHDGRHGVAVEQRDDIFRLLTDHMLRRDQHKGAQHLDIAAATRTRRLRLEEMALWMQNTSGADEFTLTAPDMEDRLVEYLVVHNEMDADKANREAEAFLHWCVDRSGFLTLNRRGYHFQQPLVQQYLASCALLHDLMDSGAPAERLTEIAVARADDPHWAEVILFLASQLPKTPATRLVAGVGSARTGYDDLSRRGVLTAVRIMAECLEVGRDVRLATLGALWNELDVGAVRQSRQRLSGSWRRVYREGLALLPTLRGTESEEDAVLWLVSRTAPERPPVVRARAFELLGALGSARQEALEALLEALRAGEDPTVQDNARRALAGISRSQERALAALEALAGDEARDRTRREHAGRALMQLRRRFDVTLRLGLTARSASKAKHFLKDWLRVAREGANDPYSTWHAEVPTVLDALREARRDGSETVRALAGRLLTAVGEDMHLSETRRTPSGPLRPAETPAPGIYAGEIRHYWPGVAAAVIAVARTFEVGAELRIVSPESRQNNGTPTDFRQRLASIQVEHESVQQAFAGTHAAIRVMEKVRPGDRVYVVES